MCWDPSQYIRTSFLPGYNNLLIKSWANVPGSESGLCCAKNIESVPELGTFSHPVHSKTHQLQLQKTLSPAKCGKVSSPPQRCAVIAFPGQSLYPEGSRHAVLGRSSCPGGTRKKAAGSGANFCALNEAVRRLLSACWLAEKGLFLHDCFHEGSSDFPVICDNLVVPRVSSFSTPSALSVFHLPIAPGESFA